MLGVHCHGNCFPMFHFLVEVGQTSSVKLKCPTREENDLTVSLFSQSGILRWYAAPQVVGRQKHGNQD